jgi:small subunit ribosomal protein S1
MSEQVQSQEEFLNFNWHNFEEGIDPVNQKTFKEFEELVTKHLFLLIKKK